MNKVAFHLFVFAFVICALVSDKKKSLSKPTSQNFSIVFLLGVLQFHVLFIYFIYLLFYLIHILLTLLQIFKKHVFADLRQSSQCYITAFMRCFAYAWGPKCIMLSGIIRNPCCSPTKQSVSEINWTE